MTQQRWEAVDEYVEREVLPEEPELRDALRASREAGLPPIDVPPSQGRLLELLVRIHGAAKVLEIGTLGGYSTLWMARALPADGLLVTLEAQAHHADVARRNLERGLAGRADAPRVEVRTGPASETLPLLEAESVGPFDFFFIDADKPSNPVYLDWALRLSRPGSVIVVDNVVRDGAVADPEATDPKVVGSREALELIGAEPRLAATAVQTVGGKGYDGFALAVVTG